MCTVYIYNIFIIILYTYLRYMYFYIKFFQKYQIIYKAILTRFVLFI